MLIWKEAREHVWKMLALTAMVLSPLIMFFYRNMRQDDVSTWLMMTIFFLSWIAPVWIGAWTAAGERNSGAFDVLIALPARPLIFFVLKTAFGLVTMLVPLMLAMGISAMLSWRASDQLLDHSLWIMFPSSMVALYFLIIFAASGARKEGRAAVIGVLVLLGCLIWGAMVMLFAEPAYGGDPPPWYLVILNPFLLLVVSDGHPDIWSFVPLQIITIGFWAVAAGWRFLRIASRSGTGSEEREIPATITILFPTRYPPLLWKEFREQIGVLGAAFLSAVGIAVMAGTVSAIDESRRGITGAAWDAMGVILQAMIVAGAVIPLLLSVVLGVGSLAGDLEERIVNFWRGQPISPARLFWTKYLVSAVGILLLLIFPISFAVGGSSMLNFNDGNSYFGSDGTRLEENAWIVFIATLVVLPVAHALSIFFASVLRRTMYATIVAVVALLCIGFLPLGHNQNLVILLTDKDQNPFVIFTVFLCSIIATMILLLSSRIALVRNWRFG